MEESLRLHEDPGWFQISGIEEDAEKICVEEYVVKKVTKDLPLHPIPLHSNGTVTKILVPRKNWSGWQSFSWNIGLSLENWSVPKPQNLNPKP